MIDFFDILGTSAVIIIFISLGLDKYLLKSMKPNNLYKSRIVISAIGFYSVVTEVLLKYTTINSGFTILLSLIITIIMGGVVILITRHIDNKEKKLQN